MSQQSAFKKVFALLLPPLILAVTMPFSIAETVAAFPLGTVTAQGGVTVGNVSAPTGTTIFAGDQVTSKEPALIRLNSGARIEMTKAAATFARQGDTLVVRAQEGLIRFNFPETERVQIDAGGYSFSAIDKEAHIGELGLNRKGQLVMNMKQGAFAALNTNTGERAAVTPNRPLAVLTQSGQGQLTKGGKSLTDTSKIYQANELKGMCVVGAGEAFRIVGNTASVITIDGTWKTNSGAYDYKVVECTKQAMMNAGASEAAATAAAKSAAAAGAAGGISSHTTALVIAGVAATGGLGIGIYEATKSSSSR